MTSTSTTTPVLDLEGAAERLALPPEVLAGILGDFRKNYAGVATEISGLIEAGDMEAAGRLAHSLKGLAATLGAVVIEAPAAKLEAAIDAGDAFRAKMALAELAAKMAAAVAEIDAWLAARA